MKLIEMMVLLFMLPLFGEISFSVMKEKKALADEIYEERNSLECDRFIISSLKKAVCVIDEFDSIAEWEMMCASLWNLTSISVEPIGFKNDLILYRCEWEKNKEKKRFLVVKK